MNAIDIAILAVQVIFLVKGLLRGLLREVCSLLGLGAGALLAFRYHGGLAAEMARTFKLPGQFCVVVVFIALFLIGVLVFAALGYVLSRAGKLPLLGGANRVAGGLFGLLQAVSLLAVVLYGLSLRPYPQALGPILHRSALAPPFVQLGEATMRGGARVFAEGR